jgi:hypothetical protein
LLALCAAGQKLAGLGTTVTRILDRDTAREAVRLALPTIELMMTDPAKGDSGCLHTVIMDPLADPAAQTFEESILHEPSVNRASWDADYAEFARAKARVSWRTRGDGHFMQALHPHLLEPGDTLLWGSVCRDSLVVAPSGMQPWYDEALAGIVACCARSHAQAHAREAEKRGLSLVRDEGG